MKRAVSRFVDVFLRRCEGGHAADLLAHLFATWARETTQVTRPRKGGAWGI